MGGVLIFTSINEDGSLHGSAISLAGLAAQNQLSAIGCTFVDPVESFTSSLGKAGFVKLYSVKKGVELLSLKQKALFLKKVIEKEKVSEVWIYQNKDLASYLAGVLSAAIFENVSDRSIEGSTIVVKNEIYAGKFISKSKTKKDGMTVISFGTTPVAKAASTTNCSVEIISDVNLENVSKSGELIPSEKQEGISLPDAKVVLDIGDGLGTKGIPTMKKLGSILKVMGVKVAVGGTRVVTDAGRLPRNAQIGISGISVQPDLIISVGISGAPQHWAGMQKAKYKVCVNTDAKAPLMTMSDYPVVGDGHLFIKDLTDALMEMLTAEQKELLNKSSMVKKVTESSESHSVAAVHLEHLNDLPLNIDLRSIYFEAFEVYKVQEISEHWNIDKMKALLEKVARFSEKFVNQGKRDAERIGVIFRPGEEFKEKSVLAPQSYHKAWAEYYKSGFGRLATPRALGGLELPHGFMDYVIEIFSAGSPALGTYFGLTQGAALIISTFGSDWMKENVLPGLINGRFQGTMCLTEANAGSDLNAVSTTAVQIPGTEIFELNGTKIFITSGDHDITENHWHIVLAKIPGTGFEGTRAISLFLVPKFWVNDEGTITGFNEVVTQSIEHKSGMMTSPTCVTKLNNSKGFLIGGSIQDEVRSPSGMKKMFFFMNAMRHETGTAGRGQAVATCLDALVYSNERKQGVAIKDMGKKIDQSVIIHHGNQKKTLMDMFARTLGDRALTQKLTELRDRSHHKFDEGMHKYKTKMNELNLNEEQKKQLEVLTQKLGKADSQTAKAKEAKKRLSKKPDELDRVNKELTELIELRNSIRSDIKKISEKYLELQDFKKKLKQEKEDVETYASIFTSLVKAQVTDDNVKTLIDGMQSYGGIGFMAETPVAQRLHDSQILCIWEGTNDIQSLNTVFRQIGNDVKDSKGNIIFLKVIGEMEEFLKEYHGHHRLDSSIALLKKYVKELLAFRNAMTVSTWRDKLKYMQLNYGLKLKPSKEESIAAQMKWGMMMQAVARNFNTYFSQAVQAWQLLRIAIIASNQLDLVKRGAKATIDMEVFDENFLEGRILVARHFVASPACLDKSLFCWKEFFYNNAAINMEYDHLADKPSRITMA